MKSCVFLLTAIAVFALSPISIAEDVYINGGTHTFNDATYENDSVYLDYESSTHTEAVLIEGGIIGHLAAYGDSSVEIGGYTPEEYIPGGIIKESLIANESAHIFIHGGSIGNTLEVFQNGTITLFGTDFQVADLDGITTALSHGDKLSDFGTRVIEDDHENGTHLVYNTGTITGTLADGSIVNNTFKIYDFGYGGDIHIRRKIMAYRPVFVAMSKQGTGLLLKANSLLTVITVDTETKIDHFDVNSQATDAVLVQGNASIDANKLHISGGMTIRGSLNYPNDMVISENLGFYGMTSDTFHGFEPSYAGLPDLCPINPNTGKVSPVVITGGQWILESGYYSAGIIVEDATVSFLPGIYHLGGSNAPSGLILKGASVVDANEVMFHLVEGGQVSVGNNAVLTASASTSGDYKGFLFFQSQDNTSPAVFKGGADCVGGLYFPANHVEVAGQVYCSILMADTIELSSHAELTVNPNYLPSE